MAVEAFELGDLEGEYVDGPAHTRSNVDLTVEHRGDRVVLTQTARHRAVPDRAIRSELDPDAARELQRELERVLEE